MQYRLFMTANEILGDTTDIWELFLVSRILLHYVRSAKKRKSLLICIETKIQIRRCCVSMAELMLNKMSFQNPRLFFLPDSKRPFGNNIK